MSYDSFPLSIFQNNFKNPEIIDGLANANTSMISIIATFLFFGFLFLSVSMLAKYFSKKDKFFLNSGLFFLLLFLTAPYSTIALMSSHLQVSKKDMLDTNYFNSLSDADKDYFKLKMDTINKFSRSQVGDELTAKEALTGNFAGKHSSKIYLSDLDEVITEIKKRNLPNQ